MTITRSENPFFYNPADNNGADLADLNPEEAYEAGVNAALKGFTIKDYANPYLYDEGANDGAELADLSAQEAYEAGVSAGWDVAE